jgi:hypothetical protein
MTPRPKKQRTERAALSESWSSNGIIRSRREALGPSQTDLASALGITKSLLSLIKAAGEPVSPGPAVECVAARLAAQHVGAAAAGEPVGPGPAVECVAARFAAQHVGAAEPAQPVVTAAAGDPVGEGRSGQHIGPRPADERYPAERSGLEGADVGFTVAGDTALIGRRGGRRVCAADRRVRGVGPRCDRPRPPAIVGERAGEDARCYLGGRGEDRRGGGVADVGRAVENVAPEDVATGQRGATRSDLVAPLRRAGRSVAKHDAVPQRDGGQGVEPATVSVIPRRAVPADRAIPQCDLYTPDPAAVGIIPRRAVAADRAVR